MTFDPAKIRLFLLFLGDGRTGSTLTGSLIDAHAHACISLEENILDLVAGGATRDELYRRIVGNAAGNRRRVWTGYSYRVEGQHQGGGGDLRVIGDKQAGRYSIPLARNRALYADLAALVGVPVKAINSVRNSYDVIATRFRWQSKGRTLSEQEREALLERLVRDHFAIYDAVESFRGSSGCPVLDVGHESFVHHPVRTLRRICEFLELDADERYLSDCSRIVNESPHESRFELDWNSRRIGEIARRMKAYPYMAHYRYDE